MTAPLHLASALLISHRAVWLRPAEWIHPAGTRAVGSDRQPLDADVSAELL